ncbi:MAG: cyclic nucleotide-binding domain-containing protein [Pseudomonadota bacterium]
MTQENEDFITKLGIDMVAQSPLGSDLSPEECDTLAGIITVQALKAGDTLIEEGHKDDSIHVVVSGHLAVNRSVAGGGQTTLHVLTPGDMAGELGFIDGQAHSATLTALGDTEVFSIKREHFESLLYDKPDIIYQVMRAIMRTVHSILRRMNLQHVELCNYINHQHGRY